ncbi:hypothetical protein RclHR1_14690007 [Rhizophagus clarus]|uniref:F-box domain-containing protein n=1 Tax=Rhizophagus clarus TaxID=94130 RepID=A0A2Z6QHM9_9GLOM|nr:hypothetical protein RclHR1_14690007 [Rhizophagus clarus]GES99304.1 hypothetical protein GLOIN_2v1784405 [Rhizophagus clarus]
MTCQLPSDCFNEIFEYLEKDRLTLHSCLLVNRLWCELSVRILWRNVWDFESLWQQYPPSEKALSILNTLIACLSSESKELLYKSEIPVLTITSKLPLFNYAAFCKILSINYISKIIVYTLKDEPSRNHLIVEEIVKMFANQICSLRKLSYYHDCHINLYFPYFPGLKDLSELHCSSNLSSNFFYQLSQICNNLHTLNIEFNHYNVSLDELKSFISLQSNLKVLTLSANHASWDDIIPALKNNSKTITKLCLYGNRTNLPFSFISLFSNLQEFTLSFVDRDYVEDFKSLKYVSFSNLQTLKILYKGPRTEYNIKFLETNGKNLKKIYFGVSNDKSIKLTIANFCLNLRSLFVIFDRNELEILKTIFNNCQHLESIKIWCGTRHLTEKEVFETIANYSPNNFHELKIYNTSHSVVSLEDLESFFISWKNRIPKRLLYLIIIKYYFVSLDNYEKNMKLIEKYENLGIIKLRTKKFEEERNEEGY